MLETGHQSESSELRKLFKLQLEVSRVLSRQLGTQELVESLLALICRSLNWQIGRFWTRSAKNANQLNCQAIWQSSDETVSDCDQQTIAKVWDAPETKAGKPTILKKEASASSIAIPVSAKNECLGILELFSQSPGIHTAEVVEALNCICELLAQSILEARLRDLLNESEERYHLAVDGAMDGIWDLNIETNEVYFSRPFFETLGYEPEQMSGQLQTFFDLCHPEDVKTVQLAVREHILSRTSFANVQFRLRCKDGSYLWFSGRGKALWNDKGRAIRFAGSNRDINDQKKAEERLRQSLADLERTQKQLTESEKKFRQLAENIHDIFWVCAPDASQFLYLSQTYEDLTGKPVKSVYDHPSSFMDVIVPDDREAAGLQFKAVAATNTPTEGIFRVLKKDGTVAWIEAKNFPVLDEQGNLDRVCGVARDISGLKEAEKRVSEFYSVMSHELRTPLTTINGALGLILGGIVSGSGEEGFKLLRAASDSTGHLTRLINSILDLKQLEAGRFKLTISPVAPCQLLEESISTLENSILDQKLNLTKKFRTDRQFQADYNRMLDVLWNLLSNAIKFSEAGEKIEVTSELVNDKVRLSITDHGPGIAESDLPKLFQKFQQIDSSDTRELGGAGLGLAISKALIEEQGGVIGVNSEVDKGSTFWIEFPAIQG